jgi:hypothetical protein
VRGLALVLDGNPAGAADVEAGADRLAAMGPLMRREAVRAWRDLAKALVRTGRPDDAIEASQAGFACAANDSNCSSRAPDSADGGTPTPTRWDRNMPR